ncbi:MAG: stage II sporulation protein M [Candidatus Competibacteraceae bacterium]|nr:stage II sporulation protein M [Candidatus Competibacteraceae bacterium]
MKEIRFVNTSRERWKMLEDMLAATGKKDPDRLSELYIQLTDDLSYARTYYPDSKTTQYLNGLSAHLHREIYRNKKEDSNRFVYFWTTELPLTIRKYHHIMGLSFIVFFISFTIGWISAENDPGFVRLILGDNYINMTEENILNGQPMDVYGKMREGAMFLYITLNNIYVSFLFFVLGITFGIGTLWRLFSTGIMVGAFLNFFYQKNLLTDAMLAIWMHGTIEISVAVIAGMAGLVLASGIIFPNTYSRMESIKRSAMDGLKIVMGLIPCFIIAGFIESFLTRHYNASVMLSMSVILFSLAFIITYFIIYPIYLEKKINRAKTSIIKRYNHNLILSLLIHICIISLTVFFALVLFFITNNTNIIKFLIPLLVPLGIIFHIIYLTSYRNKTDKEQNNTHAE